jgi:hypothetical protein
MRRLTAALLIGLFAALGFAVAGQGQARGSLARRPAE